MRANGKRKRNLTKSPLADDGDPNFSPNGKLIAFVSDRRADQDDLYVMRANGKRQRLLYGSTGAIEQGPNWGRKPAKKRKRR